MNWDASTLWPKAFARAYGSVLSVPVGGGVAGTAVAEVDEGPDVAKALLTATPAPASPRSAVAAKPRRMNRWLMAEKRNRASQHCGDRKAKLSKTNGV